MCTLCDVLYSYCPVYVHTNKRHLKLSIKVFITGIIYNQSPIFRDIIPLMGKPYKALRGNIYKNVAISWQMQSFGKTF